MNRISHDSKRKNSDLGGTTEDSSGRAMVQVELDGCNLWLGKRAREIFLGYN